MPLQSKTYVMKSATDEEIIKGSSGQVTSEKDYNLQGTNNLSNRAMFTRNRYIIGGLYDIGIFGLVGYCKCGKVSVPENSPPKRCSECNLTVYGSEDDQSKAYGYYIMPYATTNPVRINKLKATLKSRGLFPSSMGNLSEYKTLYMICMAGYNEKGRYELTEKTPIDEIGLDGLYKLGGFETSINRVLVIPSTCYRVCYPKRDKRTGSIILNMAGDTRMGTQLSAILSFTKFMKERMPSNLSVLEYATIKFNYVWLLYNYYKQSPILSGGKYHEVRDLTRSSIESSIRATIAPCLDLELNKVRVPAGLAYHALDEAIKDKLIDQGYTASNAIKEIKDHTQLAQEIFEYILKNETICLLWRNPTLYKNSVAVVYPELWKDVDSPAIGIPIELCVTGDTELKFTDGSKMKFEELTLENTEDKRVYSMDNSGKLVEGKISKIIQFSDQQFLMNEIYLSNEEIIKCTSDHRLMTIDGSYVRAGDLEVGVQLMSEDKAQSIHITRMKRYDSMEPMYDIEVEDYHNFILGSIVSSNCTPLNADFDIF